MEYGAEEEVELSVVVNGGNVSNTVVDPDETQALTTEELNITVNTNITWRLIYKLFSVYMGMVTVGITHALLGNILLELEFQTGAGIDKLALLFTWTAVGRFSGSSIVSVIFDRLHAEVQLGLASLLAVAFTSAIPLSKYYSLVSVAFTLQGFTLGFISTGCSAYMFWLVSKMKGATGPIVQATYFSFSVGCILGPVIAEPFLSKANFNSTSLETGFVGNLTDNCTHQMNVSNNDINIVLGLFHAGSFYPNMITSLCFVVPTIFFGVQFTIDKCKLRRHRQIDKMPNYKIVNKFMLAILLLAFFFSIGIEIVFTGFLYTYTVKVHDWDPHHANHLVKLSWIIYAVCRGLNMIAARFIKPHYILAVAITIMLMSLVLMATSGGVEHMLWVAGGGMGSAMSIQLGTWFLLGSQYMVVNGRIAGLFMTSAHVGAIVIPAITGFLFQNVGLTCFPLVLLTFSMLLLISFIALIVYGKCYSQRNENEIPDNSP